MFSEQPAETLGGVKNSMERVKALWILGLILATSCSVYGQDGSDATPGGATDAVPAPVTPSPPAVTASTVPPTPDASPAGPDTPATTAETPPTPTAVAGPQLTTGGGSFDMAAATQLTSAAASAEATPPTSQPTVSPPPAGKRVPAGAAPCDTVPDTPANCYIDGSFVGGRACGILSEGQDVYFLQSPGAPCQSSMDCSGDQYCATLAPGTPTFCYPLAHCTSTTPDGSGGASSPPMNNGSPGSPATPSPPPPAASPPPPVASPSPPPSSPPPTPAAVTPPPPLLASPPPGSPPASPPPAASPPPGSPPPSQAPPGLVPPPPPATCPSFPTKPSADCVQCPRASDNGCPPGFFSASCCQSCQTCDSDPRQGTCMGCDFCKQPTSCTYVAPPPPGYSACGPQGCGTGRCTEIGANANRCVCNPYGSQTLCQPGQTCDSNTPAQCVGGGPVPPASPPPPSTPPPPCTSYPTKPSSDCVQCPLATDNGCPSGFFSASCCQECQSCDSNPQESTCVGCDFCRQSSSCTYVPPPPLPPPAPGSSSCSTQGCNTGECIESGPNAGLCECDPSGAQTICQPGQQCNADLQCA